MRKKRGYFFKYKNRVAPVTNQNNLQDVATNENAIIRLLRKILNVKILAAVASIVAAFVAVYTIIPNEKEELISKINKNIEIIEKDFQPSLIKTDTLRKIDIETNDVIDFQRKVLEYVDNWKMVVNSKNLQNFKENKPEDVLVAITAQLARFLSYHQQLRSTLYKAKFCYNYFKLDEKNRIKPYEDTLLELNNRDSIFCAKAYEVFEDCMADARSLNDKMQKTKKLLNTSDLIKALQPSYDLYQSVEMLKFTEEFMSCMIGLNNIFIKSLSIRDKKTARKAI